jgi:transposase InsO family protein
MRVSTSGYYDWLWRPEVSPKMRADAAIVKAIQLNHLQTRRAYGSRRHAKLLRKSGHDVGRYRVRKLMKNGAVVAKQRRAYRVTTNSNHSHPIAPNLVARQFNPTAPNKTWVGDLTFIPTREGWLYLVVIIDCFSRKVVGWSLSARPNRQLVLEALRHAVKRRGVSADLIFHSDRGIQYASSDYRKELARLGIQASMSRKGNCWDNAVPESFFATFEKELLVDLVGCSKDLVKAEVFKFIEVFYNRRRLHSTLNYQTPSEFEKEQATQTFVCLEAA